ncbi:hypothetical protein BS47DRAFT_799907 [Hydnum rufescens UP504]|uniref:Uncharacterized protein n=1 Tax=Hydnum rufescens UP504 TaxID=1448309 RepID=A0A9P6B0R1_9AGAM|nr:hypothetical protein BS47DRAFT_799907 [Hydnum rufescens UP504]
MGSQHKRKHRKAAGALVKALQVLRTSGVTAATIFPGSETSASASFAEPDEAAYIKTQEELRTKTDELTLQMNAVQSQIELIDGPTKERQAALRVEKDAVAFQQKRLTRRRGKILKTLRRSSQKQARALEVAKQKENFKTVEEIESYVRDLERRIESGGLTPAQERRVLAEISSSEYAREAVEQFKVEQSAIDTKRADIEELQKRLDPQSKAISERHEAIMAEVKALEAEESKDFGTRKKLIRRRDTLATELDKMWLQKKRSKRLYGDARDRHVKKKVQEGQRKAERCAAQSAGVEEGERKEIVEGVEAQAEIGGC